MPYFLILIGAAGIFTAANQYKARQWAGLGSAIVGVVMAITIIAWVLYTLMSVMSCMMYLAVPLS